MNIARLPYSAIPMEALGEILLIRMMEWRAGLGKRLDAQEGQRSRDVMVSDPNNRFLPFISFLLIH
jgi:hypothetical protein